MLVVLTVFLSPLYHTMPMCCRIGFSKKRREKVAVTITT